MDVNAPLTPAPRRRILLLTPRFPYPPTGGDRLRILEMARQVSRRHQLTLISLCQRKEELEQEIPRDGIFSAVHRVYLPRWASWLKAGLAVIGRQPMQVAYFRSAAFSRRVHQLLPESDLVWCHLARTAPYAKEAPLPQWLEMTDAISLTLERAARLGSAFSPRTWAYRVEARRMRRYEQRLVDEFDLVTLIAEADRTQLLHSPAPRPEGIVVAPNGVALPAQAAPPAGERGPSIALLGRMDSLANRDALWYFVSEVLPGVVARVPQARLHVIGHVQAADAQRLRLMEHVKVEGVVDELSSVLDRCRVGVCPVRFGAGVQNKLLDYMAHGLATVSSPVGVEGLQVECGRDLLMAESKEDWIDKIVLLLDEDALASALGASGRGYVERHHPWDASLAPAMQALDLLITQASPCPPLPGSLEKTHP